MSVSRSRFESTLWDLVRIVSDEASSTDEAAAVVRYVLQARRARFIDVPLVRALSQREAGEELAADAPEDAAEDLPVAEPTRPLR